MENFFFVAVVVVIVIAQRRGNHQKRHSLTNTPRTSLNSLGEVYSSKAF